MAETRLHLVPDKTKPSDILPCQAPVTTPLVRFRYVSFHPLVDRILRRLIAAESQEADVWLKDDYRIARLTVVNCQSEIGQPWECAFAFYLGKHPAKLIPFFVERAKKHVETERAGTGN